MKLRLHACLWLGFALSACDKPKETVRPGDEAPTVPRVTRSARPSLDDAPDTRRKLRAELTAASEIPSPVEREMALAKVAWDALELDPELAREAMDHLPPDSPERIRLLQHLAMRMAEGNVDEALAWAKSLGTEHERAAVYGHIALVLSDTDPERAANLLSESGIEGRDFDVVSVQVLGRWAAQSPADAAAWVAMFPPGESREAGIRFVVSTWVETDAAAAFSWLDTIRDQSVRNETIAGMAAALGRQSAEQREESLGHASPTLRAEIETALDGTKKEAGNLSRPPSE